jgi:hypothetical protein
MSVEGATGELFFSVCAGVACTSMLIFAVPCGCSPVNKNAISAIESRGYNDRFLAYLESIME